MAHQGAHPGQSGMQRRLRYHFFFHDMDKQVNEYVANCPDCLLFTDKKTKEPLKAHAVPDKCWSELSVDLFGPMPSSKHIVVDQDLATRFPAAKIIKSTKADHVIPALAEIYDTYGNPDVQLSDNGPPFNSTAMKTFTEDRSIIQKKIAPLHPQANPVENFMRPLGKTMKIATYKKANQKETLTQFINNYRSTPHPATGIPPAQMLFRDPPNAAFPRKEIDVEIKDAAKLKDKTSRFFI